MENPNSVNNFMVRNPQDWKRLVDQLFPVALPKQARWTDPTAMGATQIVAAYSYLRS